jgi:hypothetical protein
MTDEATVHWDEAGRRDLTDSAAVVVALPDLSGSDELPEPFEREMHRQEFAYGSEWSAARESFQASLANDVKEVAALLPAALLLDPIEVRPYRVGPAADGWPLYIVRFLEDAKPVLENGVLLWNLAEITYIILKKARAWPGFRQTEANSSILSLSEPMLQSLVYAHVRSAYEPDGTITLESHYRTDFPGYGDPEHFGGAETYLIQAKAGPVSYGYVVSSNAKVIEHFRVYDGEVQPMPLPNWHESSFFHRQEAQVVRTIAVRGDQQN